VLWVGSDGSVALLVHGLNTGVGNTVLDVLAELFVVSIGVIGLQGLHVVGNVYTHDVLSVDISVVFTISESWESLGAVWDVQATIDGSLEGSENLGTSGGSLETNVQETLEGSWLSVDILDVELGTSGLLDSGVDTVQLELLEQTTGEQQTGGIGGGVVGQTYLDSVAWQLVRVGVADAHVTLNAGVCDLACHVLVGEANDESVFWSVVLVLVLDDQALAGIVVGLCLSTSLVLDLKSLKVSLVFNKFNKRLKL